MKICDRQQKSRLSRQASACGLPHGRSCSAYVCGLGGDGRANGGKAPLTSLTSKSKTLNLRGSVFFDKIEYEEENVEPRSAAGAWECHHSETDEFLGDSIIMETLESADRQFEDGKAIPFSNLMRDLESTHIYKI